MLVLYETAMGYCLFKLSDSAVISEASFEQKFATPAEATSVYVDALLLIILC